MLGSNKVEHNFTAKQLKGILRALTKQLGEMERQRDHKEVRAKMIDISYYNNLFYNMVSWDEYVAFDDELSSIRNA